MTPPNTEVPLASSRPLPEQRDNVAIIVPTCNASHYAARQISAVAAQTIRPRRLIAIDSSSSDGSAEIFRSAGYQVVVIRQESFDHGGTRNLGITLAPEVDVLIYLSQDAIPVGERSLEELIRPFEDPRVGVTYGRQIPQDDAGPIERHGRMFNYPGHSGKRSLPTALALGIKGIFTSNSFAAYRRSALSAVGGFPSPAIGSEDSLAAAQLLLAGWSVAYAGRSEAAHSHSYTLVQEFRRYFDIGVCHARCRDLLEPFLSTSSEGRRAVLSELNYLLYRSPGLIPEACLRTALKLVAYHFGRREATLPPSLKVRLSMNKAFFTRMNGNAGAYIHAEPRPDSLARRVSESSS